MGDYMVLSYEQFKKTVPEETAKFVEYVLSDIYYYLELGNKFIVYDNGASMPQKEEYKRFLIILKDSLQDQHIESILGKCGFKKEKIAICHHDLSTEANLDELFSKYYSMLPSFDSDTQYANMLPIDILLQSFENDCSDDRFLRLCTNPYNGINLLSDLRRYRDQIKNERKNQLQQKLYLNLPMSVISYLETASRIRGYLIKEENLPENDLISKSLFLALYLYDDPEVKEDCITMQKTIEEFLEESGLGLDNDFRYKYDRAYTSIDTLAIDKYYKRYFQEGIYAGKDPSTVTVAGIVENLFNREFTGSLIIEKMMAQCNCHISQFMPFEQIINKRMEEKISQQDQKYIKNFYKNMRKDTREYIEFTCKTYMLLQQEMQKQQHNTTILNGLDDADTLALLIASYYYDGEVSQYFKDNGVTLEKILKLIGFDIHKKDIEAVELNKRLLVDKYKRFVYGGVNKEKIAEEITINDIDHNLCNREFNKSMIIENLFYELANGNFLNSDFLEMLKDYFVNKERKRKKELAEELFRDMPAETIRFLEGVSVTYHSLKKQCNDYSEEDLKCLSLLIEILSPLNNNNEIHDFFESQGYTIDEIKAFLGINYIYLDHPIDIDLLQKEYGAYIFGGHNKNRERKDLTIAHIASNIFNRELNNSCNMIKFLDEFGHKYEDYDDFDQKYEDFINENLRKKKIEDHRKRLYEYDLSIRSYITEVLKIYQIILEKKSKNELETPLIVNRDDMLELVLVLGLFYLNGNISVLKFFEKNNITKENILHECGLRESDFDGLSSTSIDYALIPEDIYKYFDGQKDISSVAKNMFELDGDSSFLEKLCSQIGTNYDVLKKEVQTEKDYVVLLPINDRITFLANAKVDSLVVDDIMSVLHFGNSLAIHTDCIQDEHTKLELNDIHDKAIATIQEIVGRVYDKQHVQKKKRGFFSRLFVGDKDEEDTNITLNAGAIEELKSAIDTNIEWLSQELVGYDKIRQYMEVYRRKNRAHYVVAKQEEEKINAELASLDPKDDDQYDRFLQVSTLSRIMAEKTSRFATTNLMMQQELVKVNQAIMTHFITINTLELAKHDLLPIIGSELAIAKGRDTENQALELSQNVIALLQDLLAMNVDGAVKNMEHLKNAAIPPEIFSSLSRDIQTYVDSVERIGSASERVAKLDIDDVNSPMAGKIDVFDAINKPLELKLPDPLPDDSSMTPDQSKRYIKK